MAAINNDLVNTKHTLNVTHATVRETLAGSPTTLGTSEPGTPTFSYTIQESDLPTFDGVPYSVKYTPVICAGGTNTDVSNARNLCYRVKLNGTSKITATNLSATANQKWTVSLNDSSLVGVVVGDVIDVYLWETTGSLNWSWQGLSVLPTRIFVTASNNRVLYKVAYTNSGNFPTFSLGTPGTVQYNNKTANGLFTDTNLSANTTVTFECLTQNTTKGIFTIDVGDVLGTRINNHATTMPYTATNYKLTKIEWYPTKIGV